MSFTFNLNAPQTLTFDLEIFGSSIKPEVTVIFQRGINCLKFPAVAVNNKEYMCSFDVPDTFDAGPCVMSIEVRVGERLFVPFLKDVMIILDSIKTIPSEPINNSPPNLPPSQIVTTPVIQHSTRPVTEATQKVLSPQFGAILKAIDTPPVQHKPIKLTKLKESDGKIIHKKVSSSPLSMRRVRLVEL